MRSPLLPGKGVPSPGEGNADTANISYCGRTVITAMASPSATALCCKLGGSPLPGDLVMDREVTEVLLVRLWLGSCSCRVVGPSWKVRFRAAESLLRPHMMSHSAGCVLGGDCGHARPPWRAVSLCIPPQLLGCDLGSAALTLLHPCHGTCDWRGMMPRRGEQCKSASP